MWTVFGVFVGMVFGEQAGSLRPLGDLFMRLLLMAAIPLVFFNLVSGISGLTDTGGLGKLGIRTLLYYLATTSAALTVGLAVAFFIEPGSDMRLTSEIDESVANMPGLSQVLLDMVPSNMFLAFSSGNVVQVVVVAVFLGVSILLIPQPHRENLRDGFALITSLLKKLVGLVLAFSPIGIAALVAASVGQFGGALFGPLAKFIGTVWAAQLVMVCGYLSILRLSTGRAVWPWLRKTGPLYATTAATCSSLASLVVAMEVARKRLKLPENVYSFTLPLGAQLNKDGTAITLVVVLLTTTQALGIEFTVPDLLAVVFVGLILSEGSGGVPQGGLVLAFIFLQSFNLPLEVAGVLAGVYRLVDMGNTTVNCMGDMTWTTVVSDRFDGVRGLATGRY